jgi:2-keto-3-deoxy-galactonokinase
VGALLEKVIAEVSKLPDGEQEAFAAWALAELLSEHRWDGFHLRSEDLLEHLAEEAHQEYLAGLTEPLDPERL